MARIITKEDEAHPAHPAYKKAHADVAAEKQVKVPEPLKEEKQVKVPERKNETKPE